LAAGLVLQVVAVRSCNAWAAVLAAALLVRGGYEIEDPRDPPEHVWGPRVPRRSSRLFTTSNLAAALFFEWATIHWCTGWAAVLAAAFLFRAGFEIPPPNDQQV
jgi:hypothetical protein